MLRGLPVLATLVALVLLAGCVRPSHVGSPSLHPYDFSYRVRWHGAGRDPRVVVFSDADQTYFIVPSSGERRARVFAEIGNSLRPVDLQQGSPPYLIAGCVARRWLLTDGRAGYGAAVALRSLHGHLCGGDTTQGFFGRFATRAGAAELTPKPHARGSNARNRPSSNRRRFAVFLHPIPESLSGCHRCAQPERVAQSRSATLRALGRNCRPVSVFGRGTTILLRAPVGCHLRAAYALQGYHLLRLDGQRIGNRVTRIARAHPPLLLDFNRGLVALVARPSGDGDIGRLFLGPLRPVGRHSAPAWPLRRSLRRTLLAWCQRAGCHTNGRIPRFRLAAGRFRGSFRTALRKLLRHLARQGLVLDLYLDPAHHRLRVRTLRFPHRS
ncbi:MAG: hypothetical protein M1574_06035 [Gammaproteobacteria bacterium]|nr:hypothetical protein [Gammaproteobacteria bacterium]